LPVAEQELLLEASPMHDIGKVGTPDHILLKPGRLTSEEFEIMKQHATIGYEILRDSASPLLQCAAALALAHHEKFDGSGYPLGLAGEAIPLHGRIVAVADVFDALTSERPYKKAWALDDALKFLKANAGSHFDPACVAAFVAAGTQCWRSDPAIDDPIPTELPQGGTEAGPAMLDSSAKFVELKASGNLPSPRGSALKVMELCQRDNLSPCRS
jgi:hypothetical protein